MITSLEQLQSLGAKRKIKEVANEFGTFFVGVMTGRERQQFVDAMEASEKDGTGWARVQAVMIALTIVDQSGTRLLRYEPRKPTPDDSNDGLDHVRMIEGWDYRLNRDLSEEISKLNLLSIQSVEEVAKN